jgi:SAM-dependent methyltransferase
VTGYDTLAWFYDRYWGPRYHDAARPALERLLYRRLTAGAPVLDVCCGCGHLSEELVRRGFEVVGVDESPAMLEHARRRVPPGRFFCAAADCFALAPASCAAAISTFDSINHLTTPESARRAFCCIARALAPGALFVFDVNTIAAYTSEWGKQSAIVEDDAALFVRGQFDPASRIGQTSITTFRRDGGWQRADIEIAQRCYEPEELAPLLAAAGFADVHSVAAADAGMRGDIAVGRVFIAATMPT